MRAAGFVLLNLLHIVHGDPGKTKCPTLYATWFISDGGAQPPLANTTIIGELVAQPTPDGSFTFYGTGISISEGLQYMVRDTYVQWSLTCQSDGAGTTQKCPISTGSNGNDTVQVALLYSAPPASVHYNLLNVTYSEWEVLTDGDLNKCSRGWTIPYDPSGRNMDSCMCCDVHNFQRTCTDWLFPSQSTASTSPHTPTSTATATSTHTSAATGTTPTTRRTTPTPLTTVSTTPTTSTAGSTTPTTPTTGSTVPTLSRTRIKTPATTSSAETTKRHEVGVGTQPIDCTQPATEIQQVFCNLTETGGEPLQESINKTLSSMNPDSLTPQDIADIAQTLDKMSRARNLTKSNYEGMFSIVDKTLYVKRNVFALSNDGSMHPTKTILQSVERLLSETSMDISYLAGANLGVNRRMTTCSAQTERREYTFGLVDNGRTFSSDLSGPKAPDAAIMVPTSVMCANASSGAGLVPITSVFFIIYRSSKLFVGNSTHATNAVDAPYVTESTPDENRCSVGFSMSDDKVLTAVALSDNKTQLRQLLDTATGVPQKMVRLVYAKNKVYAPLHGDLKVSWWSGHSWSKETCKVTEKGELLVSECDHLTDFSLLVDGMQTDPALCSAFVSTVSYVVNIGSILSLLVLNGLYLVNRCTKSRAKMSKLIFLPAGQNVDTFVIVYNGILLVFYLSFSVSVSVGHVGDLTVCEVVAGVNYCLLLCCIFLTIFQAWRVLKAFAWNTNMEFIILMVTKPYVMFGFSFVVPTLIAVITGLVAPRFYDRRDYFCWIRPTYVANAVVVPLSLLILNALTCMIIVLLRLYPQFGGRLGLAARGSSRTLTVGKRKSQTEKIIALFFIQCTLGLPWVFQYFTLFAPQVTAWYVLFTLANGSQGMLLLALYVYKRYQTAKNAYVGPGGRAMNSRHLQQQRWSTAWDTRPEQM